MVYKKYIKRGGKKYGPYLYENERINGKVITRYVGRGEKNKKSNLFYIFLSLIFLISAIFILSQGHPELFTGRAPGDSGISQDSGKGGGKGNGGSGSSGSFSFIGSEDSIKVGEAETFVRESINDVEKIVEDLLNSAQDFGDLTDTNAEIQDIGNELEEYLDFINKPLEKYPEDLELLKIKDELLNLLEHLNNLLEGIGNALVEIADENKADAIEKITKQKQVLTLSSSAERAFSDIITPQDCKCSEVGECEIPYSHSAFSSGVYRAGYGLIDLLCVCADGSEYLRQAVCKLLDDDIIIEGEDDSIVLRSGGVREQVQLATIEIEEEEVSSIVFSQSPPIIPNHCYNLERDIELGEKFVDCGGECGACAFWKPREFPMFWWILLAFTLTMFVIVDRSGLVMVKIHISLGNKSLREKDLKKANFHYEKTRKSYSRLSDSDKSMIKQEGLEFLLELKKYLIKTGAKIEKSKIGKEKLPELVYDYGILEPGKIENLDVERVRKLILESENSLKENNFEEAHANYNIAKAIYISLERSEKRKIKSVYEKYSVKMKSLIDKKVKKIVEEMKKGKDVKNVRFEGLEKEVLDKVNKEL